jgi:hypothetical protein
VEELERLVQAICHVIFKQNLIEFGDPDAEQNGRDVFEAMDPLLSLRSLPANVDEDEALSIDAGEGERRKTRQEKDRNSVSMMPVVCTRERKTSMSDGSKSSVVTRRMSSK